ASCAGDVSNKLVPRWRQPSVLFLDAQRLVLLSSELAHEPLFEMARTHFQEPLPHQLPEAAALAASRGHRAVLLLCSSQAYVRQLTLPIAVVPYLRAAVKLQLAKLMPLDLNALTCDFETSHVDRDRGVVHIELAALKRRDVEPIVKSIANWGLRVIRVQIA